jgi:hypothetical protein
MIVCEPKNILEAWFFNKTGIAHRLEDACYIAEVDAEKKIKSMLVFHNWRGRSIEIDVPPGRISRSILRSALLYVHQVKCDRVTFKFRADNDSSLRAAVRLGAKREGCIRRYYPDGCDQLIYGILKEEYALG